MTQSADRADLEKFITLFCIKSTQIIVQGRIGKPISTPCMPHAGLDWKMFNLAIKDYPDIDREANAAISKGLPNSNSSYVIEISLRTSDADALVLEVWSIAFINKREVLGIRREVYNRISLLLKSLLCISRVTPAYKLSRRQGGDFVVCYRVYMGPINLVGLGEGFKTLRVGAVATPYGTFTLSTAYRTTENLHVSTQQISPEATMPFELHDDHFAMSKPYNASPAKPCRTLNSRLRTLSETSDGQPSPSIETSPSYNTFNASYSLSPLKTNLGRDDEKTTFTIGTPPSRSSSRHSITSPTWDRNSVNRRDSYPSLFGRQTPPYRTQRPTTSPVSAGSAPSYPFYGVRHKDSGTSPDSVDGRFVKTPPSGGKPITSSAKSNETTYRHWSNSNVTMVTADRNSKKAELSSSNSKKENAEWSKESNQTTTQNSKLCPTPIHELGAFVQSSELFKTPEADYPILGSSTLPFMDLISAIEDDGNSENLSNSSDSTAGDSCKHRERLSSDRTSHASSSTLSSKLSSESLEALKQQTDEYVMVDLKPAFASDNSVEDVGTFYRMCKNPPELAMFEETGGIETAETILELSKQLDDFQQNMKEFDLFVKRINT